MMKKVNPNRVTEKEMKKSLNRQQGSIPDRPTPINEVEEEVVERLRPPNETHQSFGKVNGRRGYSQDMPQQRKMKHISGNYRDYVRGLQAAKDKSE